MEINGITLLGLTAATLTTLAFLPQVIKSWRSRETRDVSLGMFAVLTVGIILWLIYGLLIGDAQARPCPMASNAAARRWRRGARMRSATRQITAPTATGSCRPK